MIRHQDFSDVKILRLIRQEVIMLGGNRKLKVYGTLTCKSGKRMKKENRVFFVSEPDAMEQGFRPCGNCMKYRYKKWKNESL